MKKIVALILIIVSMFCMVGCSGEIFGFGHYKCEKCGHVHEPSKETVFWSLHMGNTRQLTCPECGETSWQSMVKVQE